MSEQFELTEYRNWQMVAKDADGQPQVYDLEYQKHKRKLDIEKALVRQAPPLKITPSRARSVERDYQLIIDLPDIQMDFRRLPNGELRPIHNETAMKIGRLICYDLRPDTIVIGGDALDMAALSKYERDSTHFDGAQSLQMAIDGLSKYLAELRSDNPDAKIVLLAGNHEQRLNKYVLRNAERVYGIKRANSDEWPVMTVPFLLRTDEMGVEYVSGYPANVYKYNDDLIFIHGDKVRSNGSTAEMYSKEYDTNVVFHHIHRFESHSRTSKLGKTITAAAFGTLSSITGDVPSYGNGVDDKGHVVERYENWQNGLGAILVYPDGYIEMHPIHIRDNTARLLGREWSVDTD